LLSSKEHRVKTELDIVSKLDHPHIIKLLDWFESNDKYYLVFELATGGELYDRILEYDAYTEYEAAKLIHTLLSTVDYLHKHHIVHRDLKPENLLYKNPSKDAPLVLVDFGISCYVDPQTQMMKTVCGTLGYTAPEVFMNNAYTSAVDIWSIGAITFALITGAPPFSTMSEQAFLEEACSGNIEFMDIYWEHVSNEAKEFVRTLLQPDPTKRPTAEEALALPWMVHHIAKSTIESSFNLLPGIRENFNARRQLRKGVYAVHSITRWQRLVRTMAKTSSTKA
jgi:calcium/calmodulin-dependent protein kinase I